MKPTFSGANLKLKPADVLIILKRLLSMDMFFIDKIGFKIERSMLNNRIKV